MRVLDNGAGDEARTRYLHLGKVALYRMSYARIRGHAVRILYMERATRRELATSTLARWRSTG